MEGSSCFWFLLTKYANLIAPKSCCQREKITSVWLHEFFSFIIVGKFPYVALTIFCAMNCEGCAITVDYF